MDIGRPELTLSRQTSHAVLRDRMASNEAAFAPVQTQRSTAPLLDDVFPAGRNSPMGAAPRTRTSMRSMNAPRASRPGLMQSLADPRRQVMTQTLMASAVGLGTTSATAAAVPPLVGFWPALLGGVGFLGLSTAVHALPPEQVVARSVAFGASFVCLGVLVSGLSLLSSTVLTQAAILTGASMLVLGALVYTLPPDKLEGIYPVLLGASSALLVLSVVALFLPSGPFAHVVGEASVWGGLICGMGTFAHTLQRTCRPREDGWVQDPLSLSTGTVTSIVQMFCDYALLLSRHEN